MAKDPAFLYYDGDAAKDVSHMNRLERGCYFDLIQAQRKFGGYTVEQARKILGRDFDECWPALEMILACTDAGVYYIEWVADSAKKRSEYSKIQSDRIKKYWEKKKEKNGYRGISTDIPLENEIEIILERLRELTKVEEPVDEKYFAMLVLKMIEIFLASNPKYPIDKEMDYSACLQIAYRIAENKKWRKYDVVNGKMNDCLKSWKTLVEFIKDDPWLCTRSLSDLSSQKEWQRLIQKIYKPKQQKEESKSDAPPLKTLNR